MSMDQSPIPEVPSARRMARHRHSFSLSLFSLSLSLSLSLSHTQTLNDFSEVNKTIK